MTGRAEAAVCPPPESWERLLEDTATEADRASLEDHLGDCPSCRDLVDRLVDVPALNAASGRRPDAAWGAAIGRDAEEDAVPPPSVAGLSDFVEVGRGGMGVVFRARHEVLGRDVAVKVLSRSGPMARRRVVREARAMARLGHPHVVRLLDAGLSGGSPYLVMEWVGGGTLQGRIEAGPLAPREAAKIARDLALAVAEAHALGIVHRDIKPSNVLIEPGETPAAKLADFGLALADDGQSLTETGMILGTPSYMAPEQTGLVPELGPPGPPADIHALGALLYAMIAGSPPYRGDSALRTLSDVARGRARPLRESCPSVPRALEAIAAQCLRVEPSRRYTTARDLADDLDRYLAGRKVSARLLSASRVMSAGRPAAALAVALIALGATTLLPGRVEAPVPATPAPAPATSSPDVLRPLRVLSARAAAWKPPVDRGLDPADLAFLAEVRESFADPDVGKITPGAAREFGRSTLLPAEALARLGGGFLKKGLMTEARAACEASDAIHRFALRSGPPDPDRESALVRADSTLVEVLRVMSDDKAVAPFVEGPTKAFVADLMARFRGSPALKDEHPRIFLYIGMMRLLHIVNGGEHEKMEVEFLVLAPAMIRMADQHGEDPWATDVMFSSFLNAIYSLGAASRWETFDRYAPELERLASAKRGLPRGPDERLSWASASFQRLSEVSTRRGRLAEARRYALLRAENSLRGAEKFPRSASLLDECAQAALAVADLHREVDVTPAVVRALRSAIERERLWAEAKSPRSDRGARLAALNAALVDALNRPWIGSL